jgi:hypothetical protein
MNIGTLIWEDCGCLVKSTRSGALTSALLNTSISIRYNAAEVLRRLAAAAGPS